VKNAVSMSADSGTVFLDRDGVINRMRPDYVKRWAEIEFLPGALDAIVKISRSGRQVVVLTNQSAIGQNLVSVDTVEAIHRRITALVADRGGQIKAFLLCPHRRGAGCDCRKPAPGLFFRARDELGVDLGDAVMIGDQMSDMQAARAAGVKAILIDPHGARAKLREREGCAVVADLAAAAEMVCAPND